MTGGTWATVSCGLSHIYFGCLLQRPVLPDATPSRGTSRLVRHQRAHRVSYLDYWRRDPESNENRLLLTDDGSPLTEQTVTKLLSRLNKRSGITDKRMSAHTCRHWYAIRFLLKGGKLFALQRHLGHESLEMVKVYAHFTHQDAEEEKRNNSPADDVHIGPETAKRRGFRRG